MGLFKKKPDLWVESERRRIQQNITKLPYTIEPETFSALTKALIEMRKQADINQLNKFEFMLIGITIKWERYEGKTYTSEEFAKLKESK